jgi:hypothetical protein
MKVEMNYQGVARYDERCWAHITDCDRLCETNSSHGADFRLRPAGHGRAGAVRASP